MLHPPDPDPDFGGPKGVRGWLVFGLALVVVAFVSLCGWMTLNAWLPGIPGY